MSIKQNIYDLTEDQLSNEIAKLGMKPYALTQIISWLYKRKVKSFDEMTNLTQKSRSDLKERFDMDALEVDSISKSRDGTKKYRFKLKDGYFIESVDMGFDKRRTLCVSTQVGCKMGCLLCRTGEYGFKRNLTQGEILGQFLKVQSDDENPITNVVLMGMGEPLDNFENVVNAVKMMIDRRGLSLSYRRITLSTAGLIDKLQEFVKLLPIKIAISLSATTDELRNKLMPINRKFPIASIMDFCRGFSKTSKYRITFEYVMLDGVNDTKEDMKRLVRLLDGISAKINLIPLNPYSGCNFKPSPKVMVDLWSEFLHEKGIQVNIRMSRGDEIMAGCGQLIG